MQKEYITRTHSVLDALMTGKPLLIDDITRMASDASGEETKIEAIDRLMIKLCNSWVYPIGHFINKNKTPEGYEYSLVPEILNLTPEEIYGLTRKDWFTLEMVLEKIPELRQYVQKTIKRKTDIQEPAKIKATSQEKASAKKSNAEKEKTVLGIDPEMQEVVVEDVPAEGAFTVFLNEIEKIGGLRMNFRFSVKLLKK